MGLFGGNFTQLLEQAKKIQEKVGKLQAEAETKRIEGSAGGGMVQVTLNGALQVLSLKIEPELANPNDIGMLQDLVRAALNDALNKTKESYKEQFSQATGSLPLSGLFGSGS